MRLSDAGLRQRRTKVLYPNHRFPPWLTEDAAPRSLQPIVRSRSDAHMSVVGPAAAGMSVSRRRQLTIDRDQPRVLHEEKQRRRTNVHHPCATNNRIPPPYRPLVSIGPRLRSQSRYWHSRSRSDSRRALGQAAVVRDVHIRYRAPGAKQLFPSPEGLARGRQQFGSRLARQRSRLLTMRLSDAGLRPRRTKAVYPNHRLPPWLNGAAAPRSLEPIVRSLLYPSDPFGGLCVASTLARRTRPRPQTRNTITRGGRSVRHLGSLIAGNLGKWRTRCMAQTRQLK